MIYSFKLHTARVNAEQERDVLRVALAATLTLTPEDRDLIEMVRREQQRRDEASAR